LDPAKVPWGGLLTAGLTFPTVLGSKDILGIYEGCYKFSKKIYRPHFQCRMRNPDNNFCSVCEGILRDALKPYTSSSPPTKSVNFLRLIVRLKEEFSSAVDLPLSEVSDYVFAFYKNGKLEEANFLDGNPLEIRGFEDPNDRQGEFIETVPSAIVPIDIPNLTYADLELNKVQLDIIKLDRVKLQELVIDTKLDKAALDRLRKEDLITERYVFSNKEFKKFVSTPITMNPF
jgi:hypothetical protein